jgi:hypothetical protein
MATKHPGFEQYLKVWSLTNMASVPLSDIFCSRIL